MADDDVQGMPPPPTGTPPGGALAPPGVAAGLQGASGVGPRIDGAPGVLPPQGAGVPMPVKAAGDHAVGMDIMRAILKALNMAMQKLGDSKEGTVAAEMRAKAGHLFDHPEGGKEDSVDPMQRVQQAMQANRMQARGPNQGPPPTPAGVPMPNRGPVPVGGAPMGVGA